MLIHLSSASKEARVSFHIDVYIFLSVWWKKHANVNIDSASLSDSWGRSIYSLVDVINIHHSMENRSHRSRTWNIFFLACLSLSLLRRHRTAHVHLCSPQHYQGSFTKKNEKEQQEQNTVEKFISSEVTITRSLGHRWCRVYFLAVETLLALPLASD